MKVRPEEVWQQYQKGCQYLEKNNVFSDVKTNENFYEGKQWEGLPATDMPKPVINVLQRSIKFMVASLASNEIAINMIPFSSVPEERQRMKVIAEEVDNTIELARIKEHSRVLVRNGGVDGAGYMMQTFNPEIETGQLAKGAIENQLIDCTNMIFGNPYSNIIQKQPYIIVVLRQNIDQVKEEAKRLGVSKEDINRISPDNDTNLVNDDSENLVTVLLKYWKKTRKYMAKEVVNTEIGPMEVDVEKTETTVWFSKTTHNVVLIDETDLGYKRYPISCFGWDMKKNSYLYTSPMTSVIPNQVFINKTYAIGQMYGLQSCFPRIVYDKNKVNLDDFLNTPASAVASSDMMGQYLNFIKIPDFSNNIMELASDTIAQTKDTLGVTDAQLGNVKPENTSAIIALQESSAVPLEIQKQNFYEMWEDTVRNIIDIMANTYGIRQVMSEEFGLAEVDFSMLRDLNFKLSVEIGAGAQYSQIAQINTLDKYLQAGLIPGSVHAKLIPSKFLLGKDELVSTMQGYEQAQAQAQAQIGQRTLDANQPL